MTTVTDALDRLLIVKAATEGEDGQLAAIEAFGAVTGFLEAVIDDTRDADDLRSRMVYALAVNALTFGAISPILAFFTGPGSQPTDTTFNAFAHTVELLIELHEEARA